MKWTYLIPITLVSSLALDGGDATKKDIEKMQGTWQVVKQIADGRDATDKELKDADIKLVVKGAQYTVLFGGKKLTEGKLNVNATKSPRELEATDADGPLKDKARPAVYKFEADEWLVNFGQPGQPRPTDFTSKPGSSRLLLVYKRVK